MADGGGLENRYGVCASSWVRIPRPPLTCTGSEKCTACVDPKTLGRARNGHVKTTGVIDPVIHAFDVDDGVSARRTPNVYTVELDHS